MNPRRDFLLRLFALLDERGIAFVVLRNFDAVFDDNGSDIDLLARDHRAVFTTARDAAAQTAHRLVQRVRFVNHSWVFWNGAESFTRVDVDTEVRWRWFAGCDTSALLAARVRHGDFFIPAPADEAKMLRAHLAGRARSPERYLRRLKELGAPPADAAAERRRLAASGLLNPLRWPFVLGFALADAARIFRRWLRPPGVSLSIFAAADFDSGVFEHRLAALFLPGKRGSRFKGGLALEVVRVSADAELAAKARGCGSDFIAVLESGGRMHAAHTASGFMLSGAGAAGLAHFICTALARLHEPAPAKRGVSVLLAGLDGAGKSTFARNLCAATLAVPRFSGCRYFHWIPPLAGAPDFPWPVFQDLPRKTATPGGLTSALRLVRNVALARLAWTFCVAPALRAGRLVVLDRFISNYWLDPASVRYGGPPRWLEIARRFLPKPDVLIALDAGAAILLARKGELTSDQIAVQQTRLRALPPLARRRVDLDAAQPPDALIREALTILEQT